MLGPMHCIICGGVGLVCENHPTAPWGEVSARGDACACGAGMPCPNCDPTNAEPELVREVAAALGGTGVRIVSAPLDAIDLGALASAATSPNRYTALFAEAGVIAWSGDTRGGGDQGGEDPERQAQTDEVDAAEADTSGGHQEADEPGEEQ